MTSQALKAGYSTWKEYCTAEIQSKVLNQLVGSPKITGPSASRVVDRVHQTSNEEDR